MTKYAYLDKAGIMHVVAKKDTAKEYSKTGKVVETEIEANHGYPVADGEEIIVYAEDDMRLSAEGDKLDAGKYPQLAELYRACK